jgi:hypothetical protein
LVPNSGSRQRASTRALAFICDAIARHGEDLGDGRVRIGASQASLARDARCSRGTVAYYLACLGPAILSRQGGLVIDQAALAAVKKQSSQHQRSAEVAEILVRTWGRPSTDAGVVELVGSDARAPGVRQIAACLGIARSSAQRHLEALARSGRLRRAGRRLYLATSAEIFDPPTQASPKPLSVPEEAQFLTEALGSALVELGSRLAALGAQLSNIGVTARTHRDNGARTVLAPVAQSANGTGRFVGTGVNQQIQEAMKCFLSYPENREMRASVRAPLSRDVRAESPYQDRPVVTRQVHLSDERAIAEAIAPLVAACECHGWPAVVDRTGRDWLALYSPAELRRGVTNVLREVEHGMKTNTTCRPLGLLVYKARHDEDFFAEPVLPASAPAVQVLLEDSSETPDEEAAAAVAAMDADELAALDAALRRRLRIRRLIDEVFANPETLARQRQQAWRTARQFSVNDVAQ